MHFPSPLLDARSLHTVLSDILLQLASRAMVFVASQPPWFPLRSSVNDSSPLGTFLSSSCLTLRSGIYTLKTP